MTASTRARARAKARARTRARARASGAADGGAAVADGKTKAEITNGMSEARSCTSVHYIH